MSADRLLVPADVAAVALGVTPEAVRKLAQRGRLTRHGTRRRRLYDLRECKQIIERRNTPSS